MRDAFYRSDKVDVRNIEVDVREGCVYLSGNVETRQMKRMVEDMAEGVSGVVDIQNRLIPKKVDPHLGRSISSLEDLGTV